MTHPIEPKSRDCHQNCPGNIDYKTPASIISRVNYRLAHGVLSLSADDEWLLRDAVFCVMELVAGVEELKERVEKWKTWHDSASEDAKNWRRDAQKLFGVMHNDILSALDDCVELGMTAEEMRNVIKVIVGKTKAS